MYLNVALLSSAYLGSLGTHERKCLFGEVFRHYHFKYTSFSFLILLSFWDPHNVNIVSVIVLRNSCRLSSCFFILFFILILWLDNFKSSSSLIISFAWSSLKLRLSFEFFSSVIVFFSPSICLVVGFLGVFVCVWFLFLCWTSHFLHALFSYFCLLVFKRIIHRPPHF